MELALAMSVLLDERGAPTKDLATTRGTDQDLTTTTGCRETCAKARQYQSATQQCHATAA